MASGVFRGSHKKHRVRPERFYNRDEEPFRDNSLRRKVDNARDAYAALRTIFDRLA